MLKLKLLIITSFLILTNSCEGQKKVSDNKVTVTKLKDTLNCEFVDDYYLDYLKIESSDDKIANNINSFLLLNKKVETDFNSILESVKDSIAKSCLNEEKLDLVEHEYDVTYNKNNILSITHSWLTYGYVMMNFDYYNFDIKSGNLKDIYSIVDENKSDKLLEKIKKEIENSLRTQLSDYKKNESKSDYNSFKENIDSTNREYQKQYLNNYLLKVNDSNVEGIEFKFSYDYPQAYKALEPSFELFFSFDELQPYLTKSFKSSL